MHQRAVFRVHSAVLILAILGAFGGTSHAEAEFCASLTGEPEPGSLEREVALVRGTLYNWVRAASADEPLSVQHLELAAQCLAELAEPLTAAGQGGQVELRRLRERAAALAEFPVSPSAKPPEPARRLSGEHKGVLGSISGRLTDANTNEPIPFYEVNIFDIAGEFVDAELSIASGNYSVSNLAAGDYVAFSFRPLSTSIGYSDELYNNIPCPSSGCYEFRATGDVIAVAGNDVGNIDFALEQGGTISGQVTEDAGRGVGGPMVGVQVDFWTANPVIFAGTTATNASGNYVSPVLPAGGYKVVTANTPGYIDELFINVPCAGGGCYPFTDIGSNITVANGGNVPNIDFQLAAGASASGVVTDELSGAPMTNVRVELYDGDGNQLTSYETDPVGAYTTPGLPDGTYYLRTNVLYNLPFDNHLDELYSNILCNDCDPPTGNAVALSTGITSGIDFALPRGGVISGNASRAGSSDASGIEINVWTATEPPVYVTFAITDENGDYATEFPLYPGDYYVTTVNTPDYADELFNNIACEDLDCHPFTAGAKVSTFANNIPAADNIDFVLQPNSVFIFIDGFESGDTTEWSAAVD